MKRFFYVLLTVLLAATSCGKNGLYINVDGTFWTIVSGTQQAWPCFLDDTHVCLVQVNRDGKMYQNLDGTFVVDGHRVKVTNTNNTTNLFVRTFSHLKNSSNKNFTPVSSGAPSQTDGTLWVTTVDNTVHVLFLYKGDYLSGTYENITRKEGFEYGWNWDSGTYQATGSRVTLTTPDGTAVNGTFFDRSLLAVQNIAFPLVSTATALEGRSSLQGTLWEYESSGYPGFILFTSATEFTRILLASNTIFSYLTGTYTLKNNSLEFHTDSQELNETCTIEDGAFTYLERTYLLSTSF